MKRRRHTKTKNRKPRDTFRGSMIDIWSVIHFLFGMVTSLSAVVFGIPLEFALFITFVLAIFWELFERLTHLKESKRNIASDIAMPLLATFVSYFYITRFAVDIEHQTNLLFIAIIIYGGLTWFAWEARADHETGFMS